MDTVAVDIDGVGKALTVRLKMTPKVPPPPPPNRPKKVLVLAFVGCDELTARCNDSGLHDIISTHTINSSQDTVTTPGCPAINTNILGNPSVGFQREKVCRAPTELVPATALRLRFAR